jgi:dTDP-4-dehydrorhamnose 3,5-epimerase
MKIVPTNLSDVKIIEPKIFKDDRGFFFESFNHKQFEESTGCQITFVQDNHSCSQQGVLRGLHYQKPPYEQGKLVRATSGRIFDVAVDIREGSSTFGCWTGIFLSSENKRQIWIPPGYAHGFYVLSDIAEVQYKCTAYYNPKSEGCINPLDEELGIDWPFVENAPLNMSKKDRNAKSFFESNFSNQSHYYTENKFREIVLGVKGDKRGSLIAIEEEKTIPFGIRRVYYIFATKDGVSRGYHAHKYLKQMAVCISGSCRILLDDGQDQKNVWLDSPAKGLLIENLVWHEMHDFSPDCVLMVLANGYYDEADYIRKYDDFIRQVK